VYKIDLIAKAKPNFYVLVYSIYDATIVYKPFVTYSFMGFSSENTLPKPIKATIIFAQIKTHDYYMIVFLVSIMMNYVTYIQYYNTIEYLTVKVKTINLNIEKIMNTKKEEGKRRERGCT